MLIFMGIGLLAAAAIGFGVWRASTPSTLSSTDTAMTGTTSSTASLTSSETRPSPVTEETDEEQQSMEVAPIETDDPYLAPHAHIPAPGQEPSATRIFRPSNPFETEDPTSASAAPTSLPTGAGPQGSEAPMDAPQPGEPVESAAPTEPSEPAASSEPTEPSTEPTQPTEPTEPSAEPSAEPSPAPPASTEVTLTPQNPTPEEILEPDQRDAPAATREPTETREPAATEAPEETTAPEETQQAGTPDWGSWFS